MPQSITSASIKFLCITLFLTVVKPFVNCNAQFTQQWGISISGNDSNSNTALISLKASNVNDQFSQVSSIKNTATREDIFWSKVNSQGSVIFSHTFTGPGNRKVFARDMIVSNNQNIICGYSEIDDDEDNWLVYSLNNSGVLLWVDSFALGASESDIAQRITASSSGIIIAGRVTNAAEIRNVHLRALDSAGNLLWSSTLPGNFSQNHNLVDLQMSGSGMLYVYVAQSSQATNNNRCMIYQFNQSGILLDSITVTTTNSQLRPIGLRVADNGTIYVVNQSIIAGQDINPILSAFDSSGTLLWSQSYNSAGSNKDEAKGIAVDSLGQIWILVEATFSSQDVRGTVLRYNSSGLFLGETNLQIAANSKNKPVFIERSKTNHWIVSGKEERQGQSFGFCSVLNDSGSILAVIESGINNSSIHQVIVTQSEKFILSKSYSQGGFQRLELNSFCQIPAAVITTSDTTSPCQGDSILINSIVPVGGNINWFRNDTLLIQNTPNLSVSVPGAYTVQISNQLGCKSTSPPLNVSNRPRPTPTFNVVASLCQNASTINFTGVNPSGGIFTGPGVSGSTFSPGLAGAGVHLVTYTVVGSNGCTGSFQRTITVNPQPSAFFSLDSTSLCVGSGPQILNPIQPGGVFFGTGVSGNVFNPQNLAAGLYNITYLVTNPFGCTAQLTRQVNILNPPSISVADLPALCTNSTQLLLTAGSPTGGVYSGSGVVGGSFFNPSLSGAGTFPIVYTLANAGCVARDTFNLVVNQAPNAIISQRQDSLVAPVFAGSYQWFIGNDSIIGAIDSVYLPTQNGIYSVRMKDTTSCTSFSNPLNFILSFYGNEREFLSKIELYPNPTTGSLTIEVSLNGVFELFTLDGKRLKNIQLIEGINQVDLNDLKSGFYTYSIQNERNTNVKRNSLIIVSIQH